jgi:hypothetical protein
VRMDNRPGEGESPPFCERVWGGEDKKQGTAWHRSKKGEGRSCNRATNRKEQAAGAAFSGENSIAEEKRYRRRQGEATMST